MIEQEPSKCQAYLQSVQRLIDAANGLAEKIDDMPGDEDFINEAFDLDALAGRLDRLESVHTGKGRCKGCDKVIGTACGEAAKIAIERAREAVSDVESLIEEKCFGE